MVYTLADLELAERHVAQGERHVEKQRWIVAQLEHLDTADHDIREFARELLMQFESTLCRHRDHRNKIAEVLQHQNVGK